MKRDGIQRLKWLGGDGMERDGWKWIKRRDGVGKLLEAGTWNLKEERRRAKGGVVRVGLVVDGIGTHLWGTGVDDVVDENMHAVLIWKECMIRKSYTRVIVDSRLPWHFPPCYSRLPFLESMMPRIFDHMAGR